MNEWRTECEPTQQNPKSHYVMLDKHGRARMEDFVIKLGIGVRGLIKYLNGPDGVGRKIGTVAGIRKNGERNRLRG